MESSITIENTGDPFRGEYQLSADSNVYESVLIAGLFWDQEVVINNYYLNERIKTLLELLEFIGAEIHINDKLTIYCPHISTHALPAMNIDARWIWLVAMTILVRTGKAGFNLSTIPPGQKEVLRKYIKHLESFGVNVSYQADYVLFNLEIASNNFNHAQVDAADLAPIEMLSLLLINSVRPISPSMIAKYRMDLPTATFINLITKNIDVRSGSIEFDQVEYTPVESFAIPNNQIEAVVIAILTACNQGDVKIIGVEPTMLLGMLEFFNRVGVNYRIDENQLRVWGTAVDDFAPFNLTQNTNPDFVSDFLCPIVMLASAVNGTSSIALPQLGKPVTLLQDLQQLGITHRFSDSRVAQENNAQERDVLEVIGPTIYNQSTIDMQRFKHSLLPIMSGFLSKERVTLENINIFTDRFTGFVDNIQRVGMKVSN